MVKSLSEPLERPFADLTQKSKKIISVLHVDDDLVFLKTAKLCLEMHGQFEIDVASSVEDALRKLGESEYDAVVSDYQMSGRDGLEFLKELRDKGNKIPFVIFTGKGREEVAINALNLGADGYFNKAGKPDMVYGELAQGIRLIVERNRAEASLERYNRSLADLNAISVELASLPPDVNVQEFLVKRLMELTGASAVAFTDYDANDRTLVTRLLKAKPEMQQKLTRLLGKRLEKLRFPVSKEIYNEICTKVIGKRQTLTEATFGGIPRPVGTLVQKLFGVDRFIGVAYIVDGVLYGTSLLAMKTDIPDPSTEVLESFAYIAAVSLRRHRVEESLRESEEKYRELAESISDVFFAFNKDLRYTYWNKASEKLTGIKARDAIGKSLIEVFPDSKGTELEQVYQNVVKTKKYQAFLTEHQLRGEDRIFELNAYPARDGLSVFVKDITERKKIESELRESEEKYRLVSENIPCIVFSISADDPLRVQFVSGRVEELTGYSPQKFFDDPGFWTRIIHDADREYVEKKIAEHRKNKTPFSEEYRIITRDGQVKWVKDVETRALDEVGKVTRFVWITLDITDMKKKESEIALMNEKLRIVGGLTRHDVRNKLSVIVGNTYLARKARGGKDEIDHLQRIDEAVQQISAMLDFAKTYETLGSERLAYIDVEKAFKEATSAFPDQTTVKVICDCHGLKVRADSMLVQLFHNLIDNSLKYGQKLTKLRVYCEEDADRLKLIYEDDGVGISQENKFRIWKEGFTTGKGSGRGLPLIKKIVEIYGWTIQETGETGKGARFVITILRTNSSGKENYRRV